MKPNEDPRGFFPVHYLRIDHPEEIQNLGNEPLGSKPKFWFRPRNESRPWLFKEARTNTGELWVEKAASEIAKVIGLPAAHVELAVINRGSQKVRGVIVESIIEHEIEPESDQVLRLGELIHGNEILAVRIQGYDKTKTWGQSDHCWHNILHSLGAVFPQETLGREIEKFAGLVVFDALIGNTDRHHENWALLLSITDKVHPSQRALTLAPSYDHASALGRELLDERREEILSQGRIGWYARRGRGAIFWDPGPCPWRKPAKTGPTGRKRLSFRLSPLAGSFENCGRRCYCESDSAYSSGLVFGERQALQHRIFEVHSW